MPDLLDRPLTRRTHVRDTPTDEDDRLAPNRTRAVLPREEPDFPSRIPTHHGRTGSSVEATERGEQFAKHDVGEFGRSVARSKAVEAAFVNGETVRLRSEVARDIRNRVNDLIPLVGDIAFATHLQLLKRDLSRCHDLLGSHPSEGSFLSIVTLIESAMSQLKWKEYTSEQLELIRSAADVGYRQTHVNFDDYDAIRRQFSERGIDAMPRIDLNSLSLEELTDGDEEDDEEDDEETAQDLS